MSILQEPISMRRIISIFFIILLAAAGYAAFILFKPSVHIADNTSPYLYIRTGESMDEVLQDLKSHFVHNGSMSMALRLLKYKNVRPGRYKLMDGMSLYKLASMLRNGQQSEVKMVIIKERTLNSFAGKFGKGKKYDSETDSMAMISFLTNTDTLKAYGTDTNTVMALIRPYTYDLRWNSSPSRIFRQFYSAYKNFWNTGRKVKADSLHMSPNEVTTLASIVEEETNNPQDKFNISSTYLNRLQKNMRLQADPTIKFALKNFSLKRITGSLLQVESPYNTYTHEGLPPGPICTPSEASIDAVLNAPKTDYLYFVASDKFDGSSIFTSNLTDHQKYASLYQKELTRRMDSARKANPQ
jgi:UPF0755 protein